MSTRLKAGTILVASPTLRDPNFARAVVLLCGHGSQGSFGLVINRPTAVGTSELIPGASGQVFIGGPVQRDEILILHRLGAQVEGALEVLPGVAFGGDLEGLREALAERPERLEECRVFMGYSGWSAGQLEGELAHGTWIVCRGRQEYVFTPAPERLWSQVLEDQGGAFLTSIPLDPSDN